ncbi:MAG: sulfatase-like hydrolase/transferase, partial [Pirellulaceae bacterium]|nr:sulfatase-like hydrolase/transferase [Pirellulaceae bacterium]
PKSERWSRARIRPKYKIMLEEMDKGVGRILDAVKAADIADRTLVFFLSDNGAIGAGSNQPFRGGKFSHFEGGHRVPAIAWWPGRIRAGSKTAELAMGMDLLPTFLQLAEVEPPADRRLDGLSLRGLLLNNEKLPDRPVFFGYEPKLGTAMRKGDWKLIVKGENVQLYNLRDDIGERTDLAEQKPAIVASMRAAIDAWKKDVGWTPPAD